MSLQGKFIVFDGCEGCGKSTQAALARDRMARELSLDVLLVRDPGTTRIGEQIRHILLNPDNAEMSMRAEMLLYMSARAQMMKEIIKPALDAGRTVLSDRFISSTLAYQLGGDGLTENEIRAIGDVAVNSRWPDLTIIFDLPVEMSGRRVRPKFMRDSSNSDPTTGLTDRIELRSRAYHEQVRQNYLQQAADANSKYRVIDASHAISDIHEEVWQVIRQSELYQ